MSEKVLSDLLYNDPVVKEPTPTETEVVVEEPVVEEQQEEEVPETEVVEGETSEAKETTDEVDEETEQTHTVKIRGEEKTVNLKELKNGYQRNEDYSIATRELKEKEKVVLEKSSKVDETLGVLNGISGKLDALIMGDVKNINWDELRQTDTSEYLRLKEVVEERKKALGGVVEEFNQIVKEKTAAESTALHKALGWDDASRREADIKQITDQMVSEGITEQVTSSKLMIQILKAAKYDQLQKMRKDTTKEVKTPPKVTKPVPKPKQVAPKSLEDRLYANS